ncbi:PspC domain-containing protein [Cellulomonas endophytica]|uniref:PspC domain-containing protein n=1 Tax=Cellulomonas endophytica TaxID=2494735 RepID=UPI0010118130|nr:PspC domain-containing protein [Cellulomonas endophytica]
MSGYGYQAPLGRQGLIRPRHGRLLGGVCVGLAHRFGMSPALMRVIFVATLFLIPGSQILVYPILWILMPSESSVWRPAAPRGY